MKTTNIISFYIIISFYEKLRNDNKITKIQYEKACHSLAEEMNCTCCIF